LEYEEDAAWVKPDAGEGRTDSDEDRKTCGDMQVSEDMKGLGVTRVDEREHDRNGWSRKN